MHPSFGLRDDTTAEPLTSAGTRSELARRWRSLDEEVRQDVEEDWFQRVVAELGKRHRLSFRSDLPWPGTREEMFAASAASGTPVMRRGTEFSGSVVPELVAAMINGGTFQIEMFADGELIVEVNDDLGEGGFVLLTLTDEELRDMQRVLGI